jgi:two-component sensor histidine kinase
MQRIIFLLTLFVLFLTHINAKVVDMTLEKNEYIGHNLSLYMTENHDETFEQVQAKKAAFRALNKEIDAHFFTQKTVWYHAVLNNSSKEALERYIVFDIPWLDSIEVFITDESNNMFHYETGNDLSIQNRAIPIHLSNIKHTFSHGTYDIFIKVHTQDPFVVPISVVSKEMLLQKNFQNKTTSFVIYGIVIAMSLFNLILYFIIKHPSYLYYVLFLVTFVCMNATYNNYTYEYLIGNYPYVQNWLQGGLIYLFCITGLLFTSSFLNLQTKHTKLFNATKGLIYFFIAIALVSLLLGYWIFVAFSILSVVIFGAYALVVAIYCYRQKNQSAIYFIIGLFFGLLGSLITALSVSALLPEFSMSMFKAVDYGIVIDTMMLSIALAKRYTLLYDDLKMAQKELKTLSFDLENQVKNRTHELNKELQTNKVLLKEVYHRVKNNLQLITALLSLQLYKIKDKQCEIILKENLQRIRAIGQIHEKISMFKKFKEISFEKYINEIILNYEDIFSKNKIVYEQHLNNSVTISINTLLYIGLILNELITNSIKYAFENQKDKRITLSIDYVYENDTTIFIYCDNGKGVDLESFANGFGFKLLQTLAEHDLNGKVDFYNDNGFCYKITFSNRLLNIL